ncbi:MAG: cytochrome c [Acidovorax sp.]|nr:cytochrome c [Acidovorax sp.]
MKTLLTFVLAACAATLSVPAAAQFAKAEAAIKYRQSAKTVMGHHFGTLGAMAQGKMAFDAKLAAENAAILENTYKLAWVGFGPGTEGGNAKPELWKEQDKVKKGLDQFNTEMPKLVAAAKTGNLDNLKAAFGDAAQTCKACHDNFRKKK